MRAKTFSAAIAVTGLLAVSGTAFAAADAHEAYHRAFYGDAGVQAPAENGAMGKAAYGTATSAAFVGPSGGVRVLTTNGIGAWDKSDTDSSMGKAAFGVAAGGTSSTEGQESYHRAFWGD